MGIAKVYGDAVVLVRRGGDGTTSRVNAIVLTSTVKTPVGLDRKPIKDAKPVEHLDLAFPELSLAPNGQGLKTRNLDEIFRLAYDVAPFEDGKWIGFEEPALPYTKSSGDDLYAGDWTVAGQDKDGFPVSKGSAADVTTNNPGPFVKVDAQLVPLTQLVDLSIEVSKFDPSLVISPDAVVPSAILALGRATAMLNQKPESAPPQPEVAEAAQDATQADAQDETGNQQGSQETANEG